MYVCMCVYVKTATGGSESALRKEILTKLRRLALLSDDVKIGSVARVCLADAEVSKRKQSSSEPTNNSIFDPDSSSP